MVEFRGAQLNSINLDQFPFRVYRKDLKGRFVYANAACIIDLQCSCLDDLLGKTDFDFFDESLASRWAQQEKELIETGHEVIDQVEEEIWLDRDPTWAQTSKRVERSKSGLPEFIVGVSYDITSRYLEFLRYHDAVEGHKDGVWQFDVKSGRFWLSRRCQEIIGSSDPAISNQHELDQLFRLIHPDDRERVFEIYKGITEENSTTEFDCRVQRSDTTIVHVRIRMTGTFGTSDSPIKFSGSISDRSDLIMFKSYSMFLDLVPSFIFVKDSEYRFTYVNKAICEGFAKNAKEILGKTDADLNRNKEQVASFRRDDEEVLNTGISKSIPEETFDHAKSGRRVLKTIKVALPGEEQGKFSGVVGVSTDITELWETRTYLETLMENIPDGVFFKNLKHEFTRVNEAMMKYLCGEQDRTVMGKTDADFFLADQAAKWEQEEKSLFNTGESVTGDIRPTTAHGRTQWRSVSKSPVSDPDKNVVGLVGITHDLTTERRQTQKLLITVLDEIPFPVSLQDVSGKYLLCNRAFSDYVRVPKDEISGKGSEILPDQKAWNRLQQDFQDAADGNPSVLNEHVEYDRDENPRTFSLRLSPVYEGDNGHVASVLTIRDELSQLFEKQRIRHHAHLELLSLLRSEEDPLRQHYILLLGLTHIDSFGFNRALSWRYRSSQPQSLDFIHSVGQPTRKFSIEFSDSFPELEGWSLQQCLNDFDELPAARDEPALVNR